MLMWRPKAQSPAPAGAPRLEDGLADPGRVFLPKGKGREIVRHAAGNENRSLTVPRGAAGPGTGVLVPPDNDRPADDRVLDALAASTGGWWSTRVCPRNRRCGSRPRFIQ